MCGRFFLQRDPAGLARYFDTRNATPNHAASWNIAPTQASLVVRRHPQSGERHLDSLRWGLVPAWAKDAAGAARLINARADGIAEKPSFRAAWARRRCLVPADGFYEWRAADAKQPYAVARSDGAPMALAGLWEGWKAPDGTWLKTFCIITTDANEKQALVHHRMPVILAPETWDAWLGEAPDVAALLRPCPNDWLVAWPVGRRVGKVAENDAGLLLRDPTAHPPRGLDDPPPF